MEINLLFDLENTNLPLDYQSGIVSFFKHCLEVNYPELYHKWYHNEDPVLKTYTFAVYLPKAEFTSQAIRVNSRQLQLNFRDCDLENGLYFYNAFQSQMDQSYPLGANRMTLKKIFVHRLPEIKDSTLLIQMMSPLIVRKHQKGEKDHYLIWEDEEWKTQLKQSIQQFLDQWNLSYSLETFDLIPLKPKKTVVHVYQSAMNANLGFYQLKGEPELLTLLVNAGIGSKRSSGFGCFKVIG